MGRAFQTRCFIIFSYIVGNTVLLLVAINLLLAVTFLLYDSFNPSGFSQHSSNSNTSIEQDFLRFEQQPKPFASYLHYSYLPYQSKHLNLVRDDLGFIHRTTLQPSQQNSKTVFLLGGSQTFGYLKDDKDTLQNQLQTMVRTHYSVTNYALPHYTLFQQQILFELLLLAGHRPSYVFVVLETDEPEFFNRSTEILRTEWEESTFGMRYLPLLPSIPVFRLANTFHKDRLRVELENRLQQRYPEKPTERSVSDVPSEMEVLAKPFGAQIFFVDFKQDTRQIANEIYRMLGHVTL